MYTILSSGKANPVTKRTKKGSEMYPLQNLIDIIFVQLKHLKSQNPNGSVLNEIIERTEIVAYNIQNNERSILSTNYIKDYQRNLWQQLAELRDAEHGDGNEFDLKEQKTLFYNLFKYMDRVVGDLSKSYHSNGLVTFQNQYNLS
ncbi:hypothetical protein NC796_22920 [Aliifodinibius sp. S!AR15-10]|uniref:hypothetical protein n=1 Tax=Aliifodinibius sp. S!AR15-10 TaxID=2950437 RepID=UPI00285CFD5F|nr:hypothetical protein [Aliifodinibius sp. S!AR15-10]MDR8394025.1 hypothetical protein [Aliifodinibius sp. S!AR15-10]